MKAGVRQLLGLAVAVVSFVGSIIICALSQWRVKKMPGFQVYEGLSKFCLTFSERSECLPYGPFLMRPDLVGARALIIAIIAEVIGILFGVAASKFVNFVPDERKKSKMAMASGVLFLIAGFFVLVAVCWVTNKTNAKTDFDRDYLTLGGNLIPGSRDPPDLVKKVGASVYFSWITTVLLFLGGGLLCSSFLRRDGTDLNIGYSYSI